MKPVDNPVYNIAKVKSDHLIIGGFENVISTQLDVMILNDELLSLR